MTMDVAQTRSRRVAAGGLQLAAAPRCGFTLVELLVVIMIIAMLMALITPAVMRVRSSAVNAKVKAEADMLHTALMHYKNEFGSFPPAEMTDIWNGPPTNPNGSVNTKSQAYRHLVRLFPRLSEATTGANSPYRYMAQMSPAQALVFWLQGFYANQEYPLTNNTWPPQGTRKKLYDFDETRLYAATAYSSSSGSYQTFMPRNAAPATASGYSFEREFPVYMTAHKNAGLPYVYFDSRCYDNESTGDASYRAKSLSGDSSIATPYFTSTPPANPLWTQWHVAADTFQIIAAGADGIYGENAASFPEKANVATDMIIPAVTDLTAAAGHQDNITNFASRMLADAAALEKP
jgi:prepilin-type N-terminal cleavage/methylation domain-containing protein